MVNKNNINLQNKNCKLYNLDIYVTRINPSPTDDAQGLTSLTKLLI